MTRDRRGFQYALDPVRSVTSWKIDELTLDLAGAQSRMDEQQRRVDAIGADVRAVSARLQAQRASQAVLDVATERGTHVYLARAQQALALETATLTGLQRQCEDVRAALLEARRFADSLERDREAALAEHDLGVARRGFVDADDNWMQRQYWRQST